jgi:hypothetical protein
MGGEKIWEGIADGIAYLNPLNILKCMYLEFQDGG